MFGSFAIGVIGAVAAHNEELKEFERRMALLPPEEAQAERKARARRIEECRRHRQALEIANASRPRNWLETLFGPSR